MRQFNGIPKAHFELYLKENYNVHLGQLSKIEKALKEGRIAREGLYQRMEREGVSVEDLPRYMQPVMRDAKLGIWRRTKQVFDIKLMKIKIGTL